MPPSDALDFDKLLSPITAENPAGVDLRSDPSPRSLYRQIRDALQEAQAAERKMLAPPDESNSQATADDANLNKPPDWRKVLDKTVQALAENTKDLQITAFLTEALVRQQGLAGLADGFRLAHELCERFWECLYPSANGEDGLNARLRPLSGLNDADRLIIQPIYRLPVTDATNAGGPFDCGHYKQALGLVTAKTEADREERIRRGAIPVDKLKEAATASSAAFYRRASDDLERCSAELEKLNAVLDAKCDKDAPSSSKIRVALALYGDALKALAGDRLTTPAAAAPPTVQAEPANSTAPRPPSLAMRTREEAFETLLKVAEFFRRTEPHTPVSYALEEAVRWGRMKLPDLFTELIADEAMRQQVFKRVGIRPPPATS
jgi:type VI secretion system protein ImpA